VITSETDLEIEKEDEKIIKYLLHNGSASEMNKEFVDFDPK